ncbi:MAG: YCF48-related protein [Pyrinomonadaceae bacterium]
MKAQKKIGSGFEYIFAAAFLLVFSCLPVLAGGGNSEASRFKSWDIVGPSGGDVRQIAFDPKDHNRLYVSTLDGQIHTSADAGKTWSLLVNLNRSQLILDQLFVDSEDSRIIYTSGHRHKEPGGFFKTKDGGKTWTESPELKNVSIHAMTQSVKNPNVLLVGTIDGVWISHDKGDHWEKIISATMPINVDSLAVDPRTDQTIYAGTWWRPYKTTDGGKTWRLIKEGMIDDSDVFAITIDQDNPNHLVASACSGIYESFNAGEKWGKIQGIPSQSRRTRDILQHPSLRGTIFAATTEGFWMTANSGKTWALTTQRDLVINSIAVHPDNPNQVFIGTNNYGVMVSNDGGRNFSPTNGNFTSRFTYSIKTDMESPDRIYATTQNTASGGGFVFISPDAGRTWLQARNLDVNRVSPFAIIQDRVATNVFYLASNVGLFQSFDRGMSWSQIVPPKPVRTTRRRGRSRAKTPKPEPTPEGFVQAFTDKVKVLSYTQDGKNGYWAGTDNGLYRSYDISKGWEKIDLGPGISSNIFVVTTSPLEPQTIWAGTSGSGVVVSRDNGVTWQKINGIPERFPISSITVDPQDSQKIYVGTSVSLYLSRDGGKNWDRRGGNLPLGNYTSILVNPRNTNEVYAASSLQSDGGIYFSTDAGWNWTRIDAREMKIPSRRVWGLAFDPVDSNRIFAATHSSGVYVIERQPAAPVTADTSGTRPRQIAEN